MRTRSSRKRERDQSSEDPPSKIQSIPIADSSPAPHDVVLIVKGQKFHCLKEKLAQHSAFFEKMFFSEFAEKAKKEVEIGGVEPDVFQLFIDAVNGINSMTDEYSEVALVAAIFLGSTNFEDKILEHLAKNSEITLQEQFKMAEDHKSDKLMICSITFIQVFASIKDKHELDEVLPKNLDSLCNSTKNLVMQKSLELLGIRKPPSPPLPEDSDQVFENMMNQIIDQVEVQHHHGEVLSDQIMRFMEFLFVDKYYCDEATKNIIRNDPLIRELVVQLRNAHEQSERNFIQAQIRVLKLKHFYTRLQDPENIMDEIHRAQGMRSILNRLQEISVTVNHDKRSQSRSHKLTLGDREIDEIYRRFTAEALEQIQEEPPRNMGESATWLQSINYAHDILANGMRRNILQHRIQRPRPDNLREVSNQASVRHEQEEAVNENGPIGEFDDQNPLGQHQEGN